MQRFPLIKKAPLLAVVFMSSFCVAQIGTRNSVSSFDSHPMAYDHVRNSDVAWMTTVWREIDLREKMNHPLFFPSNPTQNRSSLFDNIKLSLLSESGLKAYSAGVLGQDDMFNDALSREALDSILFRKEMVKTIDLVADTLINVEVVTELSSSDIIGYEIKEHWFIDKERSVLNIRIIGYCPLEAIYDGEGNFRGKKRLFWIYYPEARNLMASWPFFTRANDLQVYSYDDAFNQRRFSSRIIKISNVYDRSLAEYLTPVQALLESENQNEHIRNIELDMWNY